MIKDNTTIRKFELPEFNEAFSNQDNFGLNCDMQIKLGGYTCEIKRTNCDRFTVAIGTDEHPVYNKDKAVWSDVFSYRDNEDELREWYEGVREQVNNVWEQYVVTEFLDDSCEEAYITKSDRNFVIALLTFVTFVILIFIIGVTAIVMDFIGQGTKVDMQLEKAQTYSVADKVEVTVDGVEYILKQK